MWGKRALLPLIFILFLVLSAANINGIKYTENSSLAAGGLITDLIKGEIKLINGGEYKDGLVDNFDYFKNSGYPLCYTQIVENAENG